MSIQVIVASDEHIPFAETICEMMESSAKVRGTGIAKREPAYIIKKMQEGKGVIALDGENVVGFCYIESWDEQKYVANSGLIVHPDYRGTGLAKQIKSQTFNLSKKMFPNAKLFGITTSLPVMKINSELGYKPVTFSELTKDDVFWKGCNSCVNVDILNRTNRSMCLCTAMVCDLSQTKPAEVDKPKAWNRFTDFVKSRTAAKSGILKKFNDDKK